MIDFHVIGLFFLYFVSCNLNYKSFISLQIMKISQITEYSVRGAHNPSLKRFYATSREG